MLKTGGEQIIWAGTVFLSITNSDSSEDDDGEEDHLKDDDRGVDHLKDDDGEDPQKDDDGEDPQKDYDGKDPQKDDDGGDDPEDGDHGGDDPQKDDDGDDLGDDDDESDQNKTEDHVESSDFRNLLTGVKSSDSRVNKFHFCIIPKIKFYFLFRSAQLKKKQVQYLRKHQDLRK